MAAPIAMAPTTEPTMIHAFFFFDIFPGVAAPAVCCIAAFDWNVILGSAGVRPRGAEVAALESATGETFPVSDGTAAMVMINLDERWWRRRESNPRPKSLSAKSLHT